MSRNSRIRANSPNSKNTELQMVGSGKYAYLWIGGEREFYGYIDNSAKLRRFLKGAIKRLEAEGPQGGER